MILQYRKIHWTEHSKIKMRQYGLSKSKLINLLYKPERKEKGVALGTTALMQSNKTHRPVATGALAKKRKVPGEIWLMYKDIKNLRKIISAWRYPGISKPGEPIPIPKDTLQALLKNNEFK